jgi:hypothetical protein
MACRYFIEDYFGFCGVTAYSHIPRISEMERLCFKDFHACRIYNEYESSHVRVGTEEQSNSTQRMPTRFSVEVSLTRRYHEDELVDTRQGT